MEPGDGRQSKNRRKLENGRYGSLQDIGKALRFGSAFALQPRVPQREPI